MLLLNQVLKPGFAIRVAQCVFMAHFVHVLSRRNSGLNFADLLQPLG